ncbi:hypothetical protein [Paraburkholderia sp. 35.1]|uniref:hypothetical protein n=1 Tax=Paraburkholderia sp. 35.1 TaxID=2991058 RepID=UPI003D258A28
MRKVLAVTVLMLGASACLAWETVGIVANHAGGEIRLTDRPCAKHSDSFRYAYATSAKGVRVEGCWTINSQGDVAVHWLPKGYSDFWRTYDRVHFREVNSGRGNARD